MMIDPGWAAVVGSIIAAIASIFSVIWANRSKEASQRVDLRARIRQARIEERDLIGPKGFLIPTGNDAMWRDYYNNVKNKQMSRVDASQDVKTQASATPDEIIAKSPIDGTA